MIILNSEINLIKNLELFFDVVSIGDGIELKEKMEGWLDFVNNKILFMSIGKFDLKGEFYDEMFCNYIDYDYEVELNEF